MHHTLIKRPQQQVTFKSPHCANYTILVLTISNYTNIALSHFDEITRNYTPQCPGRA